MKNWAKIFLLFFVVGLLIYFNSMNSGFLMDDIGFLANPITSHIKYMLNQWNPFKERSLGMLDNHNVLAYYRPLTHMLYDLCYELFKESFWKYHLFNLLTFVFSASLIYLLIEMISGNAGLALLTSFFYLVHPINGIIVNYISAGVFALEVNFMLGAIILLWMSLDKNNDRTLYFLSLFSCFISLFWHESGVMTPFYVLTVIFLFYKGTFSKKAALLFPYFLISSSFLVFRFAFANFEEHTLRSLEFYHMKGWVIPADLFYVFKWYLVQLTSAKGIVIEWAVPFSHQFIFWNNLGIFSVFLILVLLYFILAKERICQLAILWTLIGFAPACLAAYLLPSEGITIEPHWFIFSSIGFFILVAYGCLYILKNRRVVGSVLLFFLVFYWGGLSHAYNKIWTDQITYNLYWSAQAPILSMPYFYLGQAYQYKGDFNKSRKYYKLALKDHAFDVDINNNLGVMDQMEGKSKSAEKEFLRALRGNPYSAATYNNLGSVYNELGQWQKAKRYFLQALVYNPFLVEPRRNLARIYLAHGEPSKAIEMCLQNLKTANDDTGTLLILIDIYIQKNDINAVKKYTFRIIGHETDPEILTKLAVSLSQHGLVNTAWDCFTKAIKIDPGYKDAYFNAGSVLANMGEYDKAIRIWKMGMKIDPTDQRFKANIAKAEALK